MNLNIAYFTKVQLMIQSVNTSIIISFVWLIADFIQIPESHFVRVHLTARTLETTSSHCYHMCVWKEVVVFLQQSGRGSNPGPRASEEEAVSTPPSPHLAFVMVFHCRIAKCTDRGDMCQTDLPASKYISTCKACFNVNAKSASAF